MQIPGEVLEGSGADTLLGSGWFWCRYLVRFWGVPVQMVKLLTEGLPGVHQSFIPKKRFVR